MHDDDGSTAVMALEVVPPGSEPVGVEVEAVDAAGRAALRVVLGAARRGGRLGTDFGDEPTFLLLPVSIGDGTIEVDLLSRLLPDAPDYARGFVGLAYRVQGTGDSYESVYLRPLNGTGLNPPPPRDRRGVQYYGYPDWKFDRLREEEPEGGYEGPADIAPGRWIGFRLELDGPRVRAYADGAEVLDLSQTKAVPKAGRIGLWVDIGTEGYFANLRVTRRPG